MKRRRVVMRLAREGHLKKRKFQVKQRHIVRSLSLTEAGLWQIQHLSPNRKAFERYLEQSYSIPYITNQ